MHPTQSVIEKSYQNKRADMMARNAAVKSNEIKKTAGVTDKHRLHRATVERKAGGVKWHYRDAEENISPILTSC